MKIKEIVKGYPYKPEKGCFGFSTIVLVKHKKNILFDTGGYNLRNTLAPLINNIDCVVISHLHFDHCSNLDMFIQRKTPIYISKKEFIYYEKYNNKDLDLFSYFQLIKDRLNIILVENEIVIDDNVKIVPTPGHTPGHISLEIKENNIKTIVAGDSIKSYKDYVNINNYDNAYNKEEYIKTKKIIVNKYNVVYPGHDGKIINGKSSNKMKVSEF